MFLTICCALIGFLAGLEFQDAKRVRLEEEELDRIAKARKEWDAMSPEDKAFDISLGFKRP